MRLRLIHQDDDLRVTAAGPMFARWPFNLRLFGGGPTGGPLVISFTGIGAGMDVVQTEEFVGSLGRGGRSVLFVTDRRRSWFNAPGLYERVLEVVRPYVERAGSVHTVGNSMGGFGALLFAAPLGARTALAFAPQASVSRRIIPQETRWPEHTGAIGEFRFEQISDHMGEGAAYFVVHGSGGKDAYQIEALRPRPDLRHYVFVGGRHNVAAELKETGRLGPMLEAAMACDLGRFDALARAAGACPREEAGEVLEHRQAKQARRREQAGD